MQPPDDIDSSDDESSESIRDIQRRRRDATRLRSDINALLAAPQEDDEEDATPTGPPAPPPARVFVVFQGAKWEDPDGGLRESDSIAGIHATEDAARRAAAEITRRETDRQDAWYQPYNVEP